MNESSMLQFRIFRLSTHYLSIDSKGFDWILAWLQQKTDLSLKTVKFRNAHDPKSNSTVNWWFLNEPKIIIRCVSFFSVTGKFIVGTNLYLHWHWIRKSHMCDSRCWCTKKRKIQTATNKSKTNKCICETWLKRTHHCGGAGCYSQHECAFHRSFHSLRETYNVHKA